MAEIRWYGHNCFRVRTKEATVIFDPVGRQTGYAMAKNTADLVLISHDHPGHNNLSLVKPEFKTLTGPGEYEIHDVFVYGVRTWHDAEKGAQRGHNTAYLLDAEGIRFCHLGDIGHQLTNDQLEALNSCDVLMIPIGGGTVLTAEQAVEMVGQLEPKIVIPMQFATAKGDTGLGGIEPFCKALGVAVPTAEDKLTVRTSDLSDAMRVVVLEPDSEAVKK